MHLHITFPISNLRILKLYLFFINVWFPKCIDGLYTYGYVSKIMFNRIACRDRPSRGMEAIFDQGCVDCLHRARRVRYVEVLVGRAVTHTLGL